MADQPTKHEYRSGHDPRTLRDALGCFATGVTVVTCLDDDGKPTGLTVNSFTSVSLDPPLLLVCVAQEAASAAALIAASHFAVNVLQTGQQPASIRFSTRDEDRFGADALVAAAKPARRSSRNRSGVFECERFAVHDGGDHHILVGRVVKASFDAEPRSVAVSSAAATAGCISTNRRSALPGAWSSGGRSTAMIPPTIEARPPRRRAR